MAMQRGTQRAISLLCKALLADSHLTYTATSQTTARYGSKTMTSTAKVSHAPHQLAVNYLKGSNQGLNAGFSERWFWRQSGSQAVTPYAALQSETSELATRRFAALLENYRAEWKGHGTVAGRPVDVVELWPFETVDGSSGPGKRLSLDRGSQLVLRVETFNHRRESVMVTEFSRVTINPPIAANTFKTPGLILASAQHQPWTAQEMGSDQQAVARKTGLLPPRLAQRDLPPGFAMESVGTHHCAVSSVDAALTRFSDGLNTLTVFSMRDDAKNPAKELSCDFGPGAVVSRGTHGLRVIAVGDLPPATLRRMVEKAQVQLALP